MEFSLKRACAVSIYEFKWDVKKSKVIFALGLVVTIAILGAISYRTFAGNSVSSGTGYLWDSIIVVITNDFLSGVFPMVLGGLIAVDSLAWEFDKGTILPLMAQPLTRAEIYFGKVLEKFLLLLGISLLIVGIVLGLAEAVAGTQNYLLWTVPVALAFMLELMVFASLSIFLGSIIKSSGFTIIALLAAFFALLIATIIAQIKLGFQLWITFVPLANVNLIQGSLNAYFRNPAAELPVNYNVGGVSGVSYVPASLVLSYSLLGVLLSIVIFIAMGYAVFRKSEVR